MNEEADNKLQKWIDAREKVFRKVREKSWKEAKLFVLSWYNRNRVTIPPTDEALRVAVHRMMLLNADTPEEIRTYATEWLVENGHAKKLAD